MALGDRSPEHIAAFAAWAAHSESCIRCRLDENERYKRMTERQPPRAKCDRGRELMREWNRVVYTETLTHFAVTDALRIERESIVEWLRRQGAAGLADDIAARRYKGQT
jgi:hypothetical protein